MAKIAALVMTFLLVFSITSNIAFAQFGDLNNGLDSFLASLGLKNTEPAVTTASRTSPATYNESTSESIEITSDELRQILVKDKDKICSENPDPNCYSTISRAVYLIDNGDPEAAGDLLGLPQPEIRPTAIGYAIAYFILFGTSILTGISDSMISNKCFDDGASDCELNNLRRLNYAENYLSQKLSTAGRPYLYRICQNNYDSGYKSCPRLKASADTQNEFSYSDTSVVAKITPQELKQILEEDGNSWCNEVPDVYACQQTISKAIALLNRGDEQSIREAVSLISLDQEEIQNVVLGETAILAVGVALMAVITLGGTFVIRNTVHTTYVATYCYDAGAKDCSTGTASNPSEVSKSISISSTKLKNICEERYRKSYSKKCKSAQNDLEERDNIRVVSSDPQEQIDNCLRSDDFFDCYRRVQERPDETAQPTERPVQIAELDVNERIQEEPTDPFATVAYNSGFTTIKDIEPIETTEETASQFTMLTSREEKCFLFFDCETNYKVTTDYDENTGDYEVAKVEQERPWYAFWEPESSSGYTDVSDDFIA